MLKQANHTASATQDREYATTIARQICARVFRDGGAPADALDAYGLAHEDVQGNWRAAVDLIAAALCGQQRHAVTTQPVMRRAA